LKGDLAKLASEMGNSPSDIINSYKRNVTDQAAKEWFAMMPAPNYSKIIAMALMQRDEKSPRPLGAKILDSIQAA